MTTQLQEFNPALVDNLRTHFAARNEPNVAWSDIVSNYLLLPGLRGFWPMSSCDESGGAYDMSGQGRLLKYNGNPTYHYRSLAPYIDLDGTGDYLSRTDEDGLDIIGTESYVSSTSRGLTMGGWYWLDAIPATTGGLIGKWNDNVVNQRSYLIYTDNTPIPRFAVSTDGTAIVSVISTVTMAVSGWYHIACRFTPSVELSIRVNGIETTQLVAVPATLFSSSASFRIGSFESAVAREINGRASLCFLCAASLSDGQILAMYHNSRALFGA